MTEPTRLKTDNQIKPSDGERALCEYSPSALWYGPRDEDGAAFSELRLF
jgi:hypothetical protein